MKQTICKLQNDDKTKEELIDNVVISNTNYSDAYDIITILSNSFNILSKYEALLQLLNSKADLDNSIKLYDKRDGKIYGLLIFSEYNINIGSPIKMIHPIISDYLSNLKQINGHSFLIDERLRGTNIDKKMLNHNKDFLNQYDLIWCGVETELKSHNYWKRLGFIELFSINEAKFYVIKPNKKDMLDIFILKILSKNYEKNNNKRRY